jgi:hypothetical protein
MWFLFVADCAAGLPISLQGLAINPRRDISAVHKVATPEDDLRGA